MTRAMPHATQRDRDTGLLRQIETWRAALARTFASRNTNVSERDLNNAVQRTIERIVFLRLCEDRGIEPPDDLLPQLPFDDPPFKDILSSLYPPESPCDFSALSPEILGHVYEQLLGKVIRMGSDRCPVIENGPRGRKAGGVYYTPTNIVDYVVKHTVGKRLKATSFPAFSSSRSLSAETDRSIASSLGLRAKPALSILDPACGSGSFLLGAYDYLLAWHRDRYLNDGPEIHRDRIRQCADGRWRVALSEKWRILRNYIYGVDIDPQAVETTKRSLLLKLLEGETAETLARHARPGGAFDTHALPDLSGNIKCGNSVIGTDFYDHRGMSGDHHRRINAFDWATEFPFILDGKDSGFDVVIGNPPWGQKDIPKDEHVARYLRARFESLAGIFDLFRAFVEQGIRLTRPGGYFGMVLPDIVLLKNYQETRRFILDNIALTQIDWWGMAFRSATIDAATLIGRKQQAPEFHRVCIRVNDPADPACCVVPQSDFRENDRYTFNLRLTPEKRELLRTLRQFPRLRDFFEVHEGVHSGNIRSDLFVTARTDASCRELIFGRDEIAPYVLRWNGRYVRLAALPARTSRERYANAGQPEWYDQEKVLVRRTGDYVLAAVDRERRYASNNFFVVLPRRPCALDLDGLCALLNSRFMTAHFRTVEPRTGRAFAELKIKHLSEFPLPDPERHRQECRLLNRLGAGRRQLAWRSGEFRNSAAAVRMWPSEDRIGEQIDTAVRAIFDPQFTLG